MTVFRAFWFSRVRCDGSRQLVLDPTVEEARRAALEQFVPVAVKSLRTHLGDGDPTAWRCGIRVLELFYGRGAEAVVDVALPVDRTAWPRSVGRSYRSSHAASSASSPSDSEMAATTNAAPGTVIKNGLVG